MKTLTVFFCDNQGTFDNNSPIKNTEILNFLNNLEKIRELNSSDELLFSFVSQDSANTIAKNYELIKKEKKSSKIIFGRQFYDIGYFKNNINHVTKVNDKVTQILSYVSILMRKYKVVNIYFADDCEFYHYLLTELAEFTNIHIESIIPQNNTGLIELNEIIKHDIIDQKQKVKTYQ